MACRLSTSCYIIFTVGFEELDNAHKMSLPSISIFDNLKGIIAKCWALRFVQLASGYIALSAKMRVSTPFLCDSLCGKWQLIVARWKTISTNEIITPTSETSVQPRCFIEFDLKLKAFAWTIKGNYCLFLDWLDTWRTTHVVVTELSRCRKVPPLIKGVELVRMSCIKLVITVD